MSELGLKFIVEAAEFFVIIYGKRQTRITDNSQVIFLSYRDGCYC